MLFAQIKHTLKSYNVTSALAYDSENHVIVIVALLLPRKLQYINSIPIWPFVSLSGWLCILEADSISPICDSQA